MLEQTIKAVAVELSWCCTVCSFSWPVTDDAINVTERRSADPDRRVRSRTDRRAKGTKPGRPER